MQIEKPSPWQRSGRAAGDSQTTAPHRELRLYGVNAVRARFARHPESLRKLYLSHGRAGAFADLMKWCAAHRIGYRLVDEDDLRRLAASNHHEGVVADVVREPLQPLPDWLATLPEGPCCAIWLDGVGNPHNLGAILRNAAHFGVSAVLLPQRSPLQLSGAAARVAEGGAEAVSWVQMSDAAIALQALRAAGFTLAATLVAGGDDVFATALPERLVYVLGAEQTGMNRTLAENCDLRLSIPGSGRVESLNVASATAVLLAAWARR
ncbi:rRNA methyltransferase [Lysobacteraceae bacterium NML03-0222]|nr:rRNA methyltransferase [Xanthomonadaceae bacterium NML03-0222]